MGQLVKDISHLLNSERFARHRYSFRWAQNRLNFRSREWADVEHRP